MKEFFVADGVVRLLLNDLNSARAFLRAGRLGYEILDFAGTLIKKKSTNYQKLLTERLTGMIFESRGINSELQKQQLSALSANCAGILHYSGLGFPGKDWSGLLLDNAVLSGEDLSYKNLSGSSMQYAHLENSDLTGSDLRYCDFTGVSFEKKQSAYFFLR